jgi:hypothetical protein
VHVKWEKKSEASITGTDVMIFLKIFAEKFSEKLAFFTQNKAKFQGDQGPIL